MEKSSQPEGLKSLNIIFAVFAVLFILMHICGTITAGLPYIVNALITFSVMFTSLLSFERMVSGDSVKTSLSNLGIKGAGIKEIIPGIIISAVLLLMYPFISIFTGVETTLNKEWLPNLAGLFLTGGLSEEMLFRGFLFRHLRGRMNFKKAVIASMIVFTAAHLLLFTYMDVWIALFSMILAAVISLPLSYLFERDSNTVWSPAIVHTVIRTIGLVAYVPEKDLTGIAVIWMLCCMIIPNLLMLSDKNFRVIWNKK